VVGLALCSLPEVALADTSPGTVSQIVQAFFTKTSSWSSALHDFAFALLRWTIVLEICLFGIRMALQRSQFQDIVSQFIMILLFAGLIAAVINNYQAWSWNLINGLSSVANSLGASSSSVDAPFMAGLSLVMIIFDKVSITSPGDSLAYVVCGIVVLVCFALMTAQIVLIKCEALISMNAAVIILGLGGSSIFKEYAINVMRYVFAVAFKLFIMQLLLGMALSFISDMQLAEASLQDIVVVLGISVVLLALVKTLPETCAGIINGSHAHGGQVLAATAGAVVGGAIGAAVASAGMGGAASQGVKNVREASKLAQASGAGGGFGTLGHMASSLYSAHKQAKAESPRASHGLRMGSRLQSQTQAKRMENDMKESGEEKNET